ncbi:MAG: EAL domain-containing protein [Methylophaga sp.]|nr:EAL domain-containing protein [Methylophaga sp.]
MPLTRTPKFIASNLIVAIAYFSLGLSGLQLGVTSVYATAVYPAAGLAFVAVFLGGPRLLFGVGLGAASINLWVASSFGDLGASNFIIASFIAIGCCLQAWVGVLLIKYIAKPDSKKLLSSTDIFWVLLLAGPIACLIASTWGGITLLAANIISPAELVPQWLYWWIGDTTGVVLFTPLFLMMLQYREQWWSQRIRIIAPPTLIALAMTLVIFFYISHNEREQIKHQLEKTAAPLTDRLKQKLNAYQELVGSVGNLIKVNPNLRYSEFDTFTQAIFDNHPELYALSWNPRINASERNGFESDISQQLTIPEFHISQRDKEGQLVTAEQRENYVPVAYISPLLGNGAAIGYDIASNKKRQHTLHLVNTSKQPAVTAPIKLVQESGSSTGVLLISPVILTPDSAIPAGYTVGVFRIESMLHHIFQNQLPEGLSVALYDTSSAKSHSPLYQSKDTNLSQNPNYQWTSDIHFGGRNWQLSLSPSSNYLIEQHSFLAWQALLTGLILTSLLQVILLLVTGRHNFALEKVEQLLSEQTALLNNNLVGIVTVRDRKIMWANSAFENTLGYKQDELIGCSTRQFYRHEEDFLSIGQAYANIKNKGVIRNELEFVCKDGKHLWIDMRGAILHRDINESIWVFVDVTQRKNAEQEIEHLAYYDSLTHLPNRRMVMDRLRHAMAASARSGLQGALLFLDLDYFKTLNDTLGHDVGDILLQQVAERLGACVREGDTIARFGGDEFVVMLERLDESTIKAAAQTETIAHKILTSLNQPYQLGPHKHTSSTSIGATLFKAHTSDAEELLKQADIAMYQAKSDGRNTLRFFDPEMQARINARVELEYELNQAVEKQHFQLYYQLQVDNDRKAIGAEALIRWIHPERGLIPPYEFIPLAEETGIIITIGQWVLDSACAQLKAWQQNPLTRDLSLSVNVSAKQFHQLDFAAQVQATIQRHNINPQLLKLELTESLLLGNIEDTIMTMNALAKIGIQFSLDDFGTGYSSLQYLKNLPLFQLKIDRSFVQDLVADSSDQAIVRTIISMAYSLGLTVIAEGVETIEQQQCLLSEGCTHLQGYLYSKPVPIDEFEQLL